MARYQPKMNRPSSYGVEKSVTVTSEVELEASVDQQPPKRGEGKKRIIRVIDHVGIHPWPSRTALSDLPKADSHGLLRFYSRRAKQLRGQGGVGVIYSQGVCKVPVVKKVKTQNLPNRQVGEKQRLTLR